MAEQTESSIVVDAAPAAIMEVIGDFESYPTWAKGVQVAEVRSEHPDVSIELRATAEDAAKALTAASEEAAFVVVSSHGHRGVPGFLLGSTARALVQTAKSPVIVLTGRSERRWPVHEG